MHGIYKKEEGKKCILHVEKGSLCSVVFMKEMKLMQIRIYSQRSTTTCIKIKVYKMPLSQVRYIMYIYK